jgi:hypothetical protein
LTFIFYNIENIKCRYDEEGEDSDSPSTQAMRKLRAKVLASKAGEVVSSGMLFITCFNLPVSLLGLILLSKFQISGI